MTLAFILTRLSGDLAISIAGPNATQADVEAVRKAYGLDRPLTVQFFDWVGRAATGDLGESYFFKASVSDADRRAHADHHHARPDRPGDRAAWSPCRSASWRRCARTPRSTALVQIVALLGQAMPSLLARPDPDDHASACSSAGCRSRAPARGSTIVMPGIVLAFSAIPALTRLTRAGMIQAHGLGLHPHGARQGPVARLDPAEARAAQRRHPGGGDRRGPARLHAGRLDRDRAGLRPARRRLPRLGDRSARTTSPWCRPSCWCWR